MPYENYSPEEVESRGEQMYQSKIRPTVEAGNKGKFVVIDVATGEFEVDGDDLKATRRMLAKRPGAVQYGVRIGYPAAYNLGGHLVVEQR